MKHHLICVFILASLFSSCVDENSFNPDKEVNPEKIKQAEALITTASYDVPVVDGFITTVSYNGLLLARTSSPITIKVPKTAVSRGTDKLQITYQEGQAVASYSNLWQTIVFEDSKIGDLDYNDLVFHANYQITGNKLKISIQPIALGSIRDIKLRFKWTQGGKTETVKVAEDCRKELFNGVPKFVNTHQYDMHYSKFIKEYTIELPNDKDAVDIAWFINLSDTELVYAVNQNNDKCIDENGMPYGFALTDVSNNANAARSSQSRSTVDTPEWAAYKPDVTSWAFMPAQPTVPANAIDMSGYNAKDAKANTNYIVKTGTTCDTELQFLSGTVYYVQGTMTLTTHKGNGIAKIVVLPGGVLNTKTERTEIQNVEILNYGTLNAISNFLVIGKNAILKSNKALTVSNTFNVETGGTAYIAGDIKTPSINVRNKSRLYANSIEATGAATILGNSELYVAGSADIPFIQFNQSATAYFECALRATMRISLGQNVILNVKGYLNTPMLELTPGAKINIMSGAMIEAKEIQIMNAIQSNINVVGKAQAAIISGLINFNNTGDTKALLTGNLGVASTVFQIGRNPVAVTDSRLIKNESVTFNPDQISIPKSDCTPGYNEVTDADTGISWFAYPMEKININDCYDLDEWKKGNFTFKKKPTAIVFDINNDQPVSGGKYKIYQLEK